MFPLRDDSPSHIFPFITYVIICFSGLVLLEEFTTPDLDQFFAQWALTPININLSDIRTLHPFIASMFLHGGLWHFASNMWFLYIFGDNVEAALGKFHYLLFYIAGGVFAALVQYGFNPTDQVPIVGASGAIAAILGYYFVKFPHNKVRTLVPGLLILVTIKLPARLVLFLWFGIQLINGAATLESATADVSIAWWAHIGGFVFGIIYALARARA